MITDGMDLVDRPVTCLTVHSPGPYSFCPCNHSQDLLLLSSGLPYFLQSACFISTTFHAHMSLFHFHIFFGGYTTIPYKRKTLFLGKNDNKIISTMESLKVHDTTLLTNRILLQSLGTNFCDSYLQ